MSNSFSETSSVSWFGRIKRAVGGVVIGMVLIVCMVVLLFWNEGRAVQTAKSLAEGSAVVVSAAPDAVDAANEGKLVHVTGPVTTTTIPSDADFGISHEGVRLIRTVEMYQWKQTEKSETKTKLGGGEETVTTFSYSKEWDDEPIVSSEFRQPDGHQNPPMEIRSRTVQIPAGKLGAFTLDEPVISRIGGGEALALAPDQTQAVDAAYGGNQRVSVVNGRIHLGFNPTSPTVGDYRISYEYVPVGIISVVGRQVGAQFAPYQTMAGDQLLMVQTGTVPADKMFADAVSENTIITWILRLVGLVVLVIAFAMILAPLGVLADVIPFVGSIVRMGTGLIAFLLAVIVGTITIALAWFYYRPLLAIGILAAGFVVAIATVYVGRRRKPVAASGPAPLPAPAPAQTAAPEPVPPAAPAPAQAPSSGTTSPSIKW